MKITLRKSGGISGKNWVASLESKLDENEIQNLLNQIEKDNSGIKKTADSFSYSLSTDKNKRKKWKIDIQKIPAEYQLFFKELFENLKVEE